MAELLLGARGIGSESLRVLLACLMPRLYSVFQDRLARVVLYGSYARGDEDAESDLDILVLINALPEELREYNDVLLDLSVDLSLEYGLVLSIRSKSCVEYDRYAQFVPFYRNVEREGILLYG